ncbi:MAG: WXG100 family type VII secretion target [Bifidobacterium sp.]|uniref:ESAT-6-like protein n=1 Tax=Bifidobacterium fermentum TaxID=3059035 RepID=A0AB39UQA3_9BIFI
MPNYQVDSERIRSSSAAVSSSIATIRDAVSGMYANISNLQGVWTGSAASQFNAVADQWRSTQQQVEVSLEAIQNALARASTLYEDAEVQASRLFM